jgi:hypothetical protein
MPEKMTPRITVTLQLLDAIRANSIPGISALDGNILKLYGHVYVIDWSTLDHLRLTVDAHWPD